MYTFYSLKWTFLVAIGKKAKPKLRFNTHESLGIFETGSFICGIAPSSSVLIIGRAVAGIGCSGIFSGALIILANSVPLHKRPIFTGIVAMMYGVASVIGPMLGGFFTDSKLTWRWCFYINLPAGVVTVLIISLLFTPPNRKKLDKLKFSEKLSKFDLPGTACLAPAIVCLLLALQWAGAKYQWSSGIIVGLLALSSALAITFAVIQVIRKDNGTLPPRIIGQRSIACGALFSLCMGASFFMLVYYVSWNWHPKTLL
jgi:MFS family permease